MLYGYVELENNIYCQGEASGMAFPTKLGGFNAKVHLPVLPDLESDGMPDRLLPPLGVPIEKVDWGRVCRCPDGLFETSRLVVTFGDDVDQSSLHEAFPVWKDLVERLYAIETRGYAGPSPKGGSLLRGGGFYDGLQLFDLKDKKVNIRLQGMRSVIHLELDMIGDSWSLGVDGLRLLFERAENSTQLTMVYELVLNAYRAFFSSDFRSSVMLCGSALEFAIDEVIAGYYGAHGLDFYEKDAAKHRMLGRKFRWLEELEIPIPVTDYHESVLDVRNAVTHDGLLPTKMAARAYLDKCRELIDLYSPSVTER